MKRNLFLSLLESYSPLCAHQRQSKELFTDFVVRHENCFERTLEMGHITGSAWVLDPDKTHVLLTHHRKLDAWFQLGGHSDGNPDPEAVARQEALEEGGANDLTLACQGIFDLDRHRIPEHKSTPAHWHYDVRFAFLSEERFDPAVSEESHDVKWVPLTELESFTQEESMLRMRERTKSL